MGLEQKWVDGESRADTVSVLAAGTKELPIVVVIFAGSERRVCVPASERGDEKHFALAWRAKADVIAVGDVPSPYSSAAVPAAGLCRCTRTSIGESARLKLNLLLVVSTRP